MVSNPPFLYGVNLLVTRKKSDADDIPRWAIIPRRVVLNPYE